MIKTETTEKRHPILRTLLNKKVRVYVKGITKNEWEGILRFFDDKGIQIQNGENLTDIILNDDIVVVEQLEPKSYEKK